MYWLYSIFIYKRVQIHSLASNGDLWSFRPQVESTSDVFWIECSIYFDWVQTVANVTTLGKSSNLMESRNGLFIKFSFLCKDESIKAFQYHSKPKWHRHHVQPLANSPLKPKLHRRTSLVNSELKRTIFVILVVLSFASFYPSYPEQVPATKPQPSALNGEWNPSLIYPSTWLSIYFCASTCVWTCN